MPCSLRTLLACGVSLGAHGFALDDANALVQMAEYTDIPPIELPPKDEATDTGLPPIELPPKQQAATCQGRPTRILDFSLCSPANGETRRNTLSVNNLGGQGPDLELAKEMRYSNVSQVAGVGWLDLVITNTSEWRWVNLENGHGTGGSDDMCLASINIKSKTQTTLNMKLVRHGDTEPLSGVGSFDIPFTILDVDSQNLRSEEFVILNTYREGDLHWETAGGKDRVDTEQLDTNTGYKPLRISSKSNWAGVGDLSDNPTHPQELTQGSKERSLEIRFKNRDVAEWDLTVGSKGGSAGRHFFFAGSSNLDGTTKTTTPCPCTEYPESFDWSVCDAQLVENNLGGAGPMPANSPAALRYGRVATVGESELDLVVEALNEYIPNNVSRNTVLTERNYAGIRGCYGVINVAANSLVNLRFRFVKAGTNTLADLGSESFRFTMYDMDSGPLGHAKERVVFKNPSTGSVSAAVVGSGVKALSDASKFPLEVESDVIGTGADNPLEDEATALPKESERSVGVTYSGTAEWTISLQATYSEVPGGRNFMFQGCRNLGAWLAYPAADTGFGQDRS